MSGLTASAVARPPAPKRRPAGPDLRERLAQHPWTRTGSLRLDFDTHHPQAMEVVGDRIYLSSVEIIEPPVSYPEPVDGYDRTPGKGVGHLFVLDRDGTPASRTSCSGGRHVPPRRPRRDRDGTLAAGRRVPPRQPGHHLPVDPRTFEATKMFTVADHVGGVVRDQETGRLVGQSLGLAPLLRLDGRTAGRRRAGSTTATSSTTRTASTSPRARPCAPASPACPPSRAPPPYELGGFALLDLRTRTILHEVPLQLWSTAGHVVTRNPTDLDADGNHLTMYAAPDDFGEGNDTQLLTYEATVTPLR